MSFKECTICNRKEYNDPQDGVCDDCFDDMQDLIKDGNHYVTWGMRFYRDSGKPTNPEYYEDVYASLPAIEFCDKRKKYKITMQTADFGGYDVCWTTWYYDSIDDIIKEMTENLVSDKN